MKEISNKISNLQIDEKNFDLYTQNFKIVLYQVKKLTGLKSNHSDFNDYVKEGSLGLLKSIKTFDPRRNVNFNVYATKCIRNQILMYYRKIKKDQNTLSLEEPIFNDTLSPVEHSIAYADILSYKDDLSITDLVLQNEMISELINHILNSWAPNCTYIYFKYISNNSHESICKTLNVTDVTVRHYLAQCSKKLNEYFMLQDKNKDLNISTNLNIPKNFYTLDVTQYEYNFKFCNKQNLELFKKLTSNFLNNYHSKNLSFKTYPNSKKISISKGFFNIFNFLAELTLEKMIYDMNKEKDYILTLKSFKKLTISKTLQKKYHSWLTKRVFNFLKGNKYLNEFKKNEFIVSKNNDFYFNTLNSFKIKK